MNINNKRSNFKAVLGLKSLLSVAVGFVVTQGVMVLMLQGAGLAGLGFIIPLSIGYILALTYIFSFAELSLMIPKAGSLSSYTEVALGQLPSILSVFVGYVGVGMFGIAAELLLIDYVFNYIAPNIFPDYFIGIAILVIFTLLNLLKIDVFSKIQTVLAFIMIVTLLFFGVVSVTGVITPHNETLNFTSAFNPMGIGVFSLIALAIWAFVGAEFVCPLVEEAKNPEKNIPKSMILGSTIIFITILLYCLGALLYVPAEKLSSSPLPHIDFILAIFGENGLILLGIIAVTATCSSINTAIAAVPRMLYGMAQNGQAFPQFKKLTKKTNTPWVAIIFFSAICSLPMIILGNSPEIIGLLLLSASVTWLLAYILVHINVLVLRYKYPNIHRPFKTPLYPLPQLIGIAGMIYAIVYVSPSEETTLEVLTITGLILGITSIIGILWIKLIMKQPLFKAKELT